MKPADMAAIKAALLVVRHGNGVPPSEIMAAVCTPERIQQLIDEHEMMQAMLEKVDSRLEAIIETRTGAIHA